MRVIPVLDLKGGQVVRGIAGRRYEYQPVHTRLTSSSAPVDVASAFLCHFGLDDLYLADLDAIAGAPPSLAIYQALRGLGFRLWVDAGVHKLPEAAALAEMGIEGVVVGLETVAGPRILSEIIRAIGSERVIFSLDLREAQPLGNIDLWQNPDPHVIATEAIQSGVKRLLVLDLARVGMEGGTGTEDLCARLAREFPSVQFLAGGGIRGLADLQRLRQFGVHAALVASALHDGRLSAQDLARI
jgi:phosphoribosylformimino-5-aminoimidazole carboxamide ribotide isomerase